MRTSGTSLFTAISKAQVPWQLFQVPEKFRNYIRPLGLDLLYIENWSVEAFLGHNFLHNLKEGYQDCFDSQNNSLRPFNVAKNHKNEVYYDVNLALFSVNGRLHASPLICFYIGDANQPPISLPRILQNSCVFYRIWTSRTFPIKTDKMAALPSNMTSLTC